jgi:Oxysterol-binding protein
MLCSLCWRWNSLCGVNGRLVNRAAAAADPVERMQWTVAWAMSGLQHVFQTWTKPFNPILGETWQATLSDGTAVYLEQISHHPPVSAFQMKGELCRKGRNGFPLRICPSVVCRSVVPSA